MAKKTVKDLNQDFIILKRMVELLNLIHELKKHISFLHPRNYPCKMSEQTFKSRINLECHLEDHDAAKLFKCDYCEKTFYIKWRLGKHLKQHESDDTKYSHYFNNNKFCQF